MARSLISAPLALLAALLFTPLGQALASVDANQPAGKPPAAMTNRDIIEMQKVGLASEIIIERMRHSAVAFDIGTDALIQLKSAGVSDVVVREMIVRPQGPPFLEPRNDIGQSQSTLLGPRSLHQVDHVLVKAPTEVLRAHAEKILRGEAGLSLEPGPSGYQDILLLSASCGENVESRSGKNNYTICEGSVTLESGGVRIWSSTATERETSYPKAWTNIINELTSSFVRAWKSAQRKEQKRLEEEAKQRSLTTP